MIGVAYAQRKQLTQRSLNELDDFRRSVLAEATGEAINVTESADHLVDQIYGWGVPLSEVSTNIAAQGATLIASRGAGYGSSWQPGNALNEFADMVNAEWKCIGTLLPEYSAAMFFSAIKILGYKSRSITGTGGESPNQPESMSTVSRPEDYLPVRPPRRPSGTNRYTRA